MFAPTYCKRSFDEIAALCSKFSFPSPFPEAPYPEAHSSLFTLHFKSSGGPRSGWQILHSSFYTLHFSLKYILHSSLFTKIHSSGLRNKDTTSSLWKYAFSYFSILFHAFSYFSMLFHTFSCFFILFHAFPCFSILFCPIVPLSLEYIIKKIHGKTIMKQDSYRQTNLNS